MRRTERIVRITRYLLDRPNCPISLTDLANRMDVAKSSVSEDVAMIRDALQTEGVGRVQSIAGAAGGVKYQASVAPAAWEAFFQRMVETLRQPSRILPGGFLYMSDVLADPDVLDFAGRVIAEQYADSDVNVVVTVETKGIPLAVATAHYLHVPVVIVRREHRVTDGAAVSVHYVSGSARRIQTMSVSKRAMPASARAVIVDDFMQAGATVQTVQRLLAEFDAEVVGTAVFMSTKHPQKKLVDDYISLFSVGELEEGQNIQITAGQMDTQKIARNPGKLTEAMKMNVISTNNAPAAIGPYSQAIEVGNFVITSGQIPLRPDGTLVGSGIQEQVEQVLKNLDAVLTAAGVSRNQVVKSTIFMTNLADFETVNAAYGDFFGNHRPARSTVQVAALPKGAQVEIELMAIKG